MNTININGESYTIPSGASVQIKNNKVFIDGKEATDLNNFKEKNVSIVIHGNCGDVTTSAGDLTINGDAGNVSSKSGDIEIKANQINGSVSSMSGDIGIKGSVSGKVSSMSGDVSVK